MSTEFGAGSVVELPGRSLYQVEVMDRWKLLVNPVVRQDLTDVEAVETLFTDWFQINGLMYQVARVSETK